MHISRAMQLLLLVLLLLLLELLLLVQVLLVLLDLLVELLLLQGRRSATPAPDQGGARRGEHGGRRDRADLGHRNRRFRQLRQHDVVGQVVRVRVLAMAAVELVLVLLERVLLGYGGRRR